MENLENTNDFKVVKDENYDIDTTLKIVNQALIEKGYNPINQIIGYILSGDSSYITNHKNARNLIKRYERDEILEEVIIFYLERK